MVRRWSFPNCGYDRLPWQLLRCVWPRVSSLWMDIVATAQHHLRPTQGKTTLFRYGYPHIPRTFCNHWMWLASVRLRSYRRGVEQLARDGQKHVDVDDFLRIYADAHSHALSNKNIESAFKSTGIFPFNPDEVLDRLGMTNPPSPPPLSEPCSSSTDSITNTPKTVRQIEKKQRAIRHRQHALERRSTSPTIVALKKIAKSAKLALQALAIMTNVGSRTCQQFS